MRDLPAVGALHEDKHPTAQSPVVRSQMKCDDRHCRSRKIDAHVLWFDVLIGRLRHASSGRGLVHSAELAPPSGFKLRPLVCSPSSGLRKRRGIEDDGLMTPAFLECRPIEIVERLQKFNEESPYFISFLGGLRRDVGGRSQQTNANSHLTIKQQIRLPRGVVGHPDVGTDSGSVPIRLGDAGRMKSSSPNRGHGQVGQSGRNVQKCP